MLAAQGILPGIKVDNGAKPLAGAPGERITEGLDGLRDRLEELPRDRRALRQMAGGDCDRRRLAERDVRAVPTHTRSRDMPPSARSRASCRSSNPKC